MENKNIKVVIHFYDDIEYGHIIPYTTRWELRRWFSGSSAYCANGNTQVLIPSAKCLGIISAAGNLKTNERPRARWLSD